MEYTKDNYSTVFIAREGNAVFCISGNTAKYCSMNDDAVVTLVHLCNEPSNHDEFIALYAKIHHPDPIFALMWEIQQTK